MWILVIVLLVLMFAGAPFHSYSTSWGYGPSGLLGVVVVVLIIMLLMGRL